jgi:hypothetical protein
MEAIPFAQYLLLLPKHIRYPKETRVVVTNINSLSWEISKSSYFLDSSALKVGDILSMDFLDSFFDYFDYSLSATTFIAGSSDISSSDRIVKVMRWIEGVFLWVLASLVGGPASFRFFRWLQKGG